MKLVMKGIVDYQEDRDEISPTRSCSIGGKDVMNAIRNSGFTKRVTVSIMNASFHGDLYLDDGDSGYSEVTPGWAAEINVGPHNIFNTLLECNGSEITLVVSDEPVNLIEIQSGGK